jgi:hypothetical protein
MPESYALQAANRSTFGQLVQFDPVAHQYGEFFSGYDWDIYGCLTHSKRIASSESERAVERFFYTLGKSIRSQVAYIAVPERRTSGCGLPAIPLHWHFVAAAPAHRRAALLYNAREITRRLGNSKIDYYHSEEPGAFYMAKLAPHQNFDYICHNLDHMSYHGPKDLREAAKRSDYVPHHALHSVKPTLVVRPTY